jgi:hypothetical protein
VAMPVPGAGIPDLRPIIDAPCEAAVGVTSLSPSSKLDVPIDVAALTERENIEFPVDAP